MEECYHTDEKTK